MLIQYEKGNTLLHRYDPLSKLVILLCTAVIAMIRPGDRRYSFCYASDKPDLQARCQASGAGRDPADCDRCCTLFHSDQPDGQGRDHMVAVGTHLLNRGGA